MMYLLFYILGFVTGYIALMWIFVRRKIGTIHIDMRDSRKDIVRLELKKDFDEFMQWQFAMIEVDGRWEADFYEGRQNDAKNT